MGGINFPFFSWKITDRIGFSIGLVCVSGPDKLFNHRLMLSIPAHRELAIPFAGLGSDRRFNLFGPVV